eukprot:1182993-Heterocapsa_arctica.AAC.1
MACEPLAAEPRQAGNRGAKGEGSSATRKACPPCYGRSTRYTSASRSGSTRNESSTTRSAPRPSRRGS